VADGVGEFGAAGVVDGEDEGDAGAVGGGVDGSVEFGACAVGESVASADLSESDVVGDEFVAFFGHVVDVEVHECGDFVGGSSPVLGAERVEGEVSDAELSGAGEDVADARGAGFVSGGSWEASLVGPASVAVHDDGDVFGDAAWGHAELGVGVGDGGDAAEALESVGVGGGGGWGGVGGFGVGGSGVGSLVLRSGSGGRCGAFVHGWTVPRDEEEAGAWWRRGRGGVAAFVRAGPLGSGETPAGPRGFGGGGVSVCRARLRGGRVRRRGLACRSFR